MPSPQASLTTEMVSALVQPKEVLIGAKPRAAGTYFRLWAPNARAVDVVPEGRNLRFPIEAEGDGYFSGLLPEMSAGDRYKFSLDDGEPFPDPASRYQPEGPHGPSEIVDPALTLGAARNELARDCSLTRPGALRTAHWDLHARRHVSRPLLASLRACANSASRDRMHAAGRIRRRRRMGLRRRGALCALSPLRHSGRSSPHD